MDTTVKSFWSEQHLTALWVLAILPGAWLFQRLILFGIKKFLHRRKFKLEEEESLTEYFRAPLILLFNVIGFNIVFQFWTFPEKTTAEIEHGFEIMQVVAWSWLIIRGIGFVRQVIYSRLDITQADNLRQRKIRTQFQYIEKVAEVIVVLLAFALILMTFDAARRIGSSLIASAGLAGVILGFAAQKSLGNLLAGFQIAFTQPLRFDDVVIVENEWGRIEEITLTYVVIRLWDKRRLVVPITYFIEKPFQNWTRSDASLLGYIYLYCDYSLPVEPLRAEFTRILKTTPLWDGEVSIVQVTDLTEKTMQLRFLTSARSASDAFDLRCIIREKVVGFVKAHYPHSLPTFRLENTPDVKPPSLA